MHSFFIYNGLEILVLLTLSVDFTSYTHTNTLIITQNNSFFLLLACVLLSVFKFYKCSIGELL